MNSFTLLSFVLLISNVFATINTDDRGLFSWNKSKSDKKVICYFTNWAVNRSGNASFTPADIDPSLCTHIIYSFATLNNNTLQMESQDPQIDLTGSYYQKVTSLKNTVAAAKKTNNLKVLIAIGGWTDSASGKYSRLVNNSTARSIFIKSTIAFLQKHNFDGLDWDWEYPVCWQGNCAAGPATDKENFANMVKEMRSAFKPYGFLMSAAVSAGKSTIDQAYDVPTLSENLDWLGVMSYDYHGSWDPVTGHNSPLYGPTPNSNDTIQYYLSKGAAANKLILGVPLYGRSWTLTNSSNTAVGAPATAGTRGGFTGEGGILAYYEFCNSTWTRGNVAGVGPYAYKGNQWVSFDDEAIIQEKGKYIRDNGLAGAMVWAIDEDDFNGKFCGKGKYPLLRSLNKAVQKNCKFFGIFC